LSQGVEKRLDVLLGISTQMEKSLSKIENALSGDSDVKEGKNNGSLKGIAGGLSALTAVVTNKLFTNKKADSVLSFTNGIISAVNSVDPTKTESFRKFTAGFSSSIEDLLKTFSLGNVAKLAIAQKFLFGESGIFHKIFKGIATSLKGVNIKRIQELGEALDPLGEGLRKFSKALLGMSVIAAVAPLAIVGALVIRGVVSLFVSLGKHAKGIKEGGEAMTMLGKGMMMFSAGLATMMLAILIVKPRLVMEAIGFLALFATTFALIGLVHKSIEAGAKALREVGISIAIFAGGLAALSLVMLIVQPKNILMGITMIASFGVLFALLGIPSIAKRIAEGGILLIGMAYALAAFSLGLLVFALVGKVVGFAEIIKGSAAILAIGGAFAVIGLAAKWIQSGSGAMITVGLALGAVSLGILALGLSLKALQAIFKDDLERSGIIAAGILVGLAGAFALIGIPVMAGAIATGAGAMITVGLALISISGGILIFGLAIKGLQKIFGDDLKEAGKIGGAILLGLALAFSAMGILSIPILLGSAVGLVVGASLITISVGILAYGAALKLLDKMNLLDKDGGMKGIKVLGDAAKGIAGMAKYILTVPLGAAVALGVGTALLAIGIGLSKAARALDEIPDAKAFTTKLFDEDKGIIPALAKGFASIADIAGGGFAGVLSTFLGADPVSRGIRSVKGMGRVLSELAGGIVKFANFEEFPVQVPDSRDPSKLVYTTVDIFGDVIPAIRENVPILLESLSGVFGTIGEKYGGSFFSKGIVRKGADAVQDIGSALMDLAGGVVKFADFANFPIQVPDPKDPSRLIYKTVDVFNDVIPSIAQNLPLFLTALAPVFAKIAEDYPGGFLKKSKVSKGISIVQELGSAVSDIASGIVAFADLQRWPIEWDKDGKPIKYGPVDIAAIGNSIRTAVMIMPKIFGDLDISKFEDAEKKADYVLPLTKTMKSIVTNISKISETFGKDKNIDVSIVGQSVKQLVDDISSINMEKNTLEKLDALAEIFKKFGSSGNGFAKFVDSFKEFTPSFSNYVSSMSSFSDVFKGFSYQLKNYEKFTSYLNSHAWNAVGFQKFVPSFSQISKDMKVFANNFKIMDTQTIEAFKIWTEELKDFIQIDPSNFSRNANSAEKMIDSAYKQGAKEDVSTEEGKKKAVENTINVPQQTTKSTASKEEKKDKMETYMMAMAESLQQLTMQVSVITGTINRIPNLETEGGALKVSIES
jgi:hypothetical protein